MAESLKFVDGINYTEADQADFNMRLRPEGILPEVALGVIGISLPGGLLIRVSPGEAMIQGLLYKNTANKDITVGVNSSGSTRIDTVIIKVDQAGNTGVAQVKAGTPGAGAPTLTQVVGGVWEFPLYDITVVNGATVPALTTDRRTYSRWPASTLDTAIATDVELAAEATTRAAADTAESTARASADSTLTTNLAAEVTNRTNAINSEASTRSSADTSEASTRAAAVSSEAGTRFASDNALGVRIDKEGVHCRGTISGAGAGINGTGYNAVSRSAIGTYTITTAQSYTNMIIQITPRNMGTPGSVRSVSALQASGNQFNVYITGGTEGSGMLDSDFFFCVWEAA